MSIDIIAYTDGACKGNPGIGGWGCFFQLSTPTRKSERCVHKGAKLQTTNNEMELTAMKVVLQQIASFIESIHRDGIVASFNVTIHSDSSYVLNGMINGGKGVLEKGEQSSGWLKGWKRNMWTNSKGEPVKNRELWDELDRSLSHLLLCSAIAKLDLRWVKGHSGDEGNEFVDGVANDAINSLK
jgi:ribonuclease HI